MGDSSDDNNNADVNFDPLDLARTFNMCKRIERMVFSNSEVLELLRATITKLQVDHVVIERICEDLRREQNFIAELRSAPPRTNTKESFTQTDVVKKCTVKPKMKEKIVQTDPKGKSVSKSTSTPCCLTTDKDSATDPPPPTMESSSQTDPGADTAKGIQDIALDKDTPIPSSSKNPSKEYPKPAQLVIKVVPLSVSLDKISSGLHASGFSTTSISRLKSTKSRKRIKPILISLKEPSSKAFQLKNISGYFVKVFPYRLPPSTPKLAKNTYIDFPYYRRPPPGFDYRPLRPISDDRELLSRIRRHLFFNPS